MLLFIAALSTILFVLAADEGQARTITVDDDGGEEYTKIQDAVDNAAQGDTIMVFEGTYYENVVVDKSINLVGNGSKETIIDGGNEGSVVITADRVTMSGFMLTKTGDSKLGFGINVKSDNNHFFQNNCSNTDTGIYLYEAVNNTIRDNTVTNNNYGIILYYSDYNTFENNTCESNKYSGMELDGNHNRLENNTCISNGGSGIAVYQGSYNVCENNTCENNSAGIVLSVYSHNSTLLGNPIVGNRVGIYSSSPSNTAHFNTIYGNTEQGINATSENNRINATENWFGLPSGPYHPVNNADGKGDNVSDFVDFKPWLKFPVGYVTPGAVIKSISPNPALVTDTVGFVGSTLDDRIVGRYVWRNDTGEMYNGTEPRFNLSSLPAGTYTIYFKVQDSGDHKVWSEEVNTTLVIHKKPTAEITSVLPHPALDTDTVEFKGNGTDDGTIERYVWTSSIDKELHNDTQANFTNSSLSIGTHTISFKVQDNNGIWSEEVTATLTVNASAKGNKLPVVTITSPANGATLKATVKIEGTATDEDGTVEKVEISINSGAWTAVTGIASWSYDWDSTTVKDGIYKIKVKAFDGENYSEELVWNVEVENQDDSGGGGFLPGFEVTGILIALVSCLHIFRKKG